MKKQISKVLFVGLGGVGQRHMRNFRQIMGDSVEIFAYRKRNAQFVLNNKLEIVEGETLNEKYGIKCVDTLEEAFAYGIDIVFICNPTSMHADILEKALQADCNIFIEKPIAESTEALKRIEKAVRLFDKVIYVGYQNRYHPCIMKLKQLLGEQKIGSVLSVYAEIGENVKNWHKYENYKDMYACRKALGGGVVVTQIHELDYLYYLFGMPKSVYAIGGKLSDLEIDVEDVVDILMKYEIESKEIPVSIHEDYLQTPARRGCRVVGTKGKIEIDLLASTIVWYDEQGGIACRETYDFDRNEMFMAEMQEFLKCVEQKKDSPISFQEGKKSLEIAMAVKKSMQTGMPVYMEDRG